MPRCAPIGKVLTCAAFFSGAVSVGHAQVTLDANNLRQAAAFALKDGDSERAAAYADALIRRNADDFTAHLILSRALRDQGKNASARAAVGRAWSMAETDAQKYSAALITAQVLSSDGKRTRAQLWLRRAVQYAPNAQLEAKAKRDFAYVKRRNAWSTELSFTLAPNSNINNGSARAQSELNYLLSEVLFGGAALFDLGGAAQALSGIEMGGTLRSRYRFSQTHSTAHDLKIGLSYRTFALSEDAKAQAPDVSGSDFAYGTVTLGYGFQKRNFESKGKLGADLEIGQAWYGGARYSAHLRGSLQQSYATSAVRQYRYGASVERSWGQATPDVDTLALNGSVTHQFATGNLGFLVLGAKATQSPSATSEYGEVTLRTGLALGKPVMGAALQFGLGASYRDYDVSLHHRDGRQDTRIFADITATFENVDYYGFNPTVTFSASKTNSNIGLYDTRRMGLSVGIRSAF